MRTETDNQGGLPAAAFLFIFSFILYLLFDIHPLWNNEAMYAEVPREMLESGNFLYPTLNYAPFIFKPPLFLWANAASLLIFGKSLGPRIPQALFAAGTVVFAYKIAARSSRTAGIMAGAAAATSYGFLFHTAMLLPDVPLGFFTAMAVYYFLKLSDGPKGAIGLYASLALAVMTKGFLGLVFPGAAFVIFIFAEKRQDLLKKVISLPGIAIFLAITVPWHVMMEVRNPGFLYDFIINEQVLRFFNKRNPPDWDSVSSPVFFLITLAWVMPWTAFLPQGAWMAFKKQDKNLRMALYWGVGGMAFLLMSSQKMEYYQIPLLPPLAILAGGYLAALAEGSERGRKKAAAGAFFLILFGAISALAAPVLMKNFPIPPGERGTLLFSAEACMGAIAAGGLLAYIFIMRNAYKKAFITILLAAIIIGAGSRPALDALLPELSDAEAAQAAAKVLGPKDELVVQAREEYEYSSTYCYYTGRNVLILRDGINPMVPSVFNNRTYFIISGGGLKKAWNSRCMVYFAYRDFSAAAWLAPNGLNTVYKGNGTVIRNKF